MSSQCASDDDNASSTVSKTASITAYEKSLLLQLIEDKKDIIENKSTFFAVHVKKQSAWKEIETLFNSDGQAVKRTEAQLKKVWDNWKSKAKRKVAQYKRGVRKTGGGPQPKPLPPDVDRVSSMIPEQMHSLRNPFDSDGIVELETDYSTSISVDQFLQKPAGKDGIHLQSSVNKPETSSPAEEEESENSPNSAQSVSQSRYIKQSKVDPRSMLMEYELEEHNLRMNNLRIQTQILETELNIKKRTREMMEEEHAKKMKIMDMNVPT